MFKGESDPIRNQEVSESDPETIERNDAKLNEVKELSRFRSGIMKAMFLGYAALIEACGGLKKEDIEKMPLTEIENVIRHPDDFSEVPLIKVEGYPLPTGKEKTEIMIPVLGMDTKGNMIIERYDWSTKTVDSYDIHETQDVKSPALKGYIEGNGYSMFVPIEHENEKMAVRKYDIVGKLRSTGKGKDKKYILDIQATLSAPDTGK